MDLYETTELYESIFDVFNGKSFELPQTIADLLTESIMPVMDKGILSIDGTEGRICQYMNNEGDARFVVIVKPDREFGEPLKDME